MTEPARKELPIAFALGLGGYFVALVFLQQLAFILAPVPVAVNVLAQRPNRAKVYVLVAGLAGLMGVAVGLPNSLIPCIVYSVIGWPIAWAILQGMAYKSLVIRLVAFVFVTQVILSVLQWEQIALEIQKNVEFYQGQLEGPGANSLTDPQIENLKMIVWLFENWQDVFIGFSLAGALMGGCLSIGWIFRAVRRRTAIVPKGSFADFRPHDGIVWLAIGTALMAFADSTWPNPWVQTITLNAAVGLYALYTLNGLSILLYGLDALKPNPFLAIAILMVLFMFGGVLMLSVVGLFDTWGEFRNRIDARIQSANDPENRSG